MNVPGRGDRARGFHGRTRPTWVAPAGADRRVPLTPVGTNRTNQTTTADEIQLVALEAMGRSGFDGVTVEQIAQGAGVSPSTVYRSFGTKQAIVLTGGGTERLADGVAIQAAERPKATPVELFRRSAASAVEGTDHDALLTRMQLVFGNAALTAAFEHSLLAQRDELAQAFAEHRGAKSPGGRDVAMSGALLGLTIAVLDRWQRTGGRKSLVKRLDKSLAVLG